MTNKEAAQKLADTIRAQKHTTVEDESGFSMAAVMHPCGAPCCIEGFAKEQLGKPSETALAIQELIGCGSRQAGWLYGGEFSPKPLGDVTPDEAADAIERVAGLRP